MQASLGMRALKNLFTFPFQGSNWQNKFLVGSALILGSSLIPILPILPVLGYIALVMRQTIQSQEEIPLPDWTNWGELFIDGLRLMMVGLILYLPSMLLSFLGVGIYFASFFGIVFSSASRESQPGPLIFFPMFALMFMFLVISIANILGIAGFAFTPAAQAHVAYTGHFRSFFQMRWLQILRANLSGFLLVCFLVFGLAAAGYFLFMIIYSTMILCMVIPILAAPFMFYGLLIFGLLAGQAYREGMEKAV